MMLIFSNRIIEYEYSEDEGGISCRVITFLEITGGYLKGDLNILFNQWCSFDTIGVSKY